MMHRKLVLLAWVVSAPVSMANATEYAVPAGTDVGKWFAQLPADATSVVFSLAAKYHSSGDINLPAQKMLVIDGRGSSLTLGAGSNGFTFPVANMEQAMQRTNSRYVIKDFADITGGRKAIDLKGSFGTVISNLNLVSQSETALDLRFCLMTRLQNVRVTNPVNKGFVLRQGDWPGANAANSQCNSSVLEQCRVYCAKTTTAAFTILNSGGVRMTECVSEGESCDYDLFLSATMDGDESRTANNPVVKSFTLSNFHVEHAVRKASIYVNMPSMAVVNLSNIYWNGPQRSPVLLYTMGQVNLSDIGWWGQNFWIGTRINAPRIDIARVPSQVTLGEGVAVKGNRAGIIRLTDPLQGNGTLQLNYVKVRQKSM